MEREEIKVRRLVGNYVVVKEKEKGIKYLLCNLEKKNLFKDYIFIWNKVWVLIRKVI